MGFNIVDLLVDNNEPIFVDLDSLLDVFEQSWDHME